MTTRLASNQLIEDLKKEVEGLLYTSESDAPFEVTPLSWTGEKSPEKEDFIRLLELEEGTPIQTQRLDTFFKPLLKSYDWFGEEETATLERYQKLKEYVTTQLTHTQVYRVGEVEIKVYIVGETIDQQWVALKTEATETE
ncbi:nuclease A inhibitor family protein [Siphonobacter sp. SORGH_AS_0500]|uniref:nuclease A inhibitor family protein n=1 Tax=Siphonobacter sp. SORGH_AS_0500 TaxID=1864824 RepID=UPI000CBF9C65|nr:nuclease A inhibitor family protein [Siphonobacter sp. SORGH_AS_0500]MDR6195045.1 hypothetical protein [Siphonobacter sp. SORGH_AS_0500]PKK38417.1 hypothetical protein BWI96_01180 [Siphonobacter sp. SORGH_AS_0500]